jgi:hypothetical protein
LGALAGQGCVRLWERQLPAEAGVWFGWAACGIGLA